MSPAHALDVAVEAALPDAMRLAVVVHDRDADGVREVLEPLAAAGDWTGVMALCVALAALTPVDTPYGELIAWTHGPNVPDDVYAEIVNLVRPGHKRCSDCREVQPVSEFRQDRRKRDGRKTRCRSCMSTAGRETAGKGEGAA